LELIDFGAEDVSVEGEVIRVVTSVNDWTKVKDFLKQKGLNILSAGLGYIATQKAPPMDDTAAAKLGAFIEAVEEDDDVSEVHTNA
jgi:transcriptional/translational regulatory protein YebC/TACO1